MYQTEEKGIRYCGDCKKLVFYKKTAKELKIAAKKGLCVYIESDSSTEKTDILDKVSSELDKKIHTRHERIRKINAKSLRKITKFTT